MAFVLKDLVRETTATTGNGATYSLDGAVTDFRAFDDVMDTADTTIITVRMGSDFEIIRDSAFTAGSPDTLSRSGGSAVVLASSNAGNLVDWGVGTKDIYIGIPAELLELLNMKEITVASASTCDIGAVQGGKVAISGTTTITSFGTAKNRLRFGRFSGVLTLTYNATSLILPGGSNITTAAGDTFIAMSDNSGNWTVTDYTRADGTALVGGGGVGENLLYNGGFQVSARGDGPFTSATTFANNDDVYLLDGCVHLSDGNDIADIARVANANFASGYAMEVDIETADKKLAFLFPVENRDIKGILKSGLCSAQVKAIQSSGSSIGAIRLHVLGWSSTADVITSDVVSAWNGAGANITAATNWTILGTATLSLSGAIQTVELENVAVNSSYTNLAVLVVIDDVTLTVGDKCLIGDVKLESGSQCTAFVPFPQAIAEVMCARYHPYWAPASGSSTIVGLVFFEAATQGFCKAQFTTRTRADATGVTVSSASHFTVRRTGASVTPSAIAHNQRGQDGVLLELTVTGATGGHAGQFFSASASARLVYTGAEL